MEIWHSGLSALMVAVVSLLSFGSHSPAFHTWMHGDDVHCSLTHRLPEGGGAGEELPSGEPHHDHGDPLEPFCQAGHLLQVSLADSVLLKLKIAEPVELFSSGFHPHLVFFSIPSRAPPSVI